MVESPHMLTHTLRK